MSVFDSITSLLSSGSSSSSFPFSGVGSLLLSNISGFSANASEVSPLDVIEVMGRILELERRYIQESGGFMPYTGVGEVVLAVWGSSGSSRSHAVSLLQVRVAVTTGKMTVDTIGGRPQVIGAPFTTTQRLLELAVARRSHLLSTSETLELISARPPSDAMATIRGCSGQDVPVFEFTL